MFIHNLIIIVCFINKYALYDMCKTLIWVILLIHYFFYLNPE